MHGVEQTPQFLTVIPKNKSRRTFKDNNVIVMRALDRDKVHYLISAYTVYMELLQATYKHVFCQNTRSLIIRIY